MNTYNRITDVDSYKSSHYLQYPAGTTELTAYFESRTDGEEIRFFGLQAVIKDIFGTPITLDEVEEAKEVVEAHGVPFPYEGWLRVVNEYGGRLPLRIESVEEGKVFPSHNLLFKVTSLDSELFWLVTWFETALSRVWYPTTVATRSYDLRKFIGDALERTSDNAEAELPFKLHDFGSRGVSSRETAGIGGAAHLLNFMGTDTIEGIMWSKRMYGWTEMPGFSIPASEHSTMTSWGKFNELGAMRNMIEKFGEGAIFACVSDSYDYHSAVTNLWGDALFQEVVDMNAMLVVRPDSGDPDDMVTWTLEALDDRFGSTVNSKGFRVLNNVRVIQGDGVNPDDIKRIITKVEQLGYAIDNVAFGMGGGLLQKVDRDTHKFAYKVCAAVIDGQRVEVYKQPAGQPDKRSKSGDLDLVKDPDGNYFTTDQNEYVDGGRFESELVTVVDKGVITKEYTFEQVRANA